MFVLSLTKVSLFGFSEKKNRKFIPEKSDQETKNFSDNNPNAMETYDLCLSFKETIETIENKLVFFAATGVQIKSFYSKHKRLNDVNDSIKRDIFKPNSYYYFLPLINLKMTKEECIRHDTIKTIFKQQEEELVEQYPAGTWVLYGYPLWSPPSSSNECQVLYALHGADGWLQLLEDYPEECFRGIITLLGHEIFAPVGGVYGGCNLCQPVAENEQGLFTLSYGMGKDVQLWAVKKREGDQVISFPVREKEQEYRVLIDTGAPSITLPKHESLEKFNKVTIPTVRLSDMILRESDSLEKVLRAFDEEWISPNKFILKCAEKHGVLPDENEEKIIVTIVGDLAKDFEITLEIVVCLANVLKVPVIRLFGTKTDSKSVSLLQEFKKRIHRMAESEIDDMYDISAALQGSWMCVIVNSVEVMATSDWKCFRLMEIRLVIDFTLEVSKMKGVTLEVFRINRGDRKIKEGKVEYIRLKKVCLFGETLKGRDHCVSNETQRKKTPRKCDTYARIDVDRRKQTQNMKSEKLLPFGVHGFLDNLFTVIIGSKHQRNSENIIMMNTKHPNGQIEKKKKKKRKKNQFDKQCIVALHSPCFHVKRKKIEPAHDHLRRFFFSMSLEFVLEVSDPQTSITIATSHQKKIGVDTGYSSSTIYLDPQHYRNINVSQSDNDTDNLIPFSRAARDSLKGYQMNLTYKISRLRLDDRNGWIRVGEKKKYGPMIAEVRSYEERNNRPDLVLGIKGFLDNFVTVIEGGDIEGAPVFGVTTMYIFESMPEEFKNRKISFFEKFITEYRESNQRKDDLENIFE